MLSYTFEARDSTIVMPVACAAIFIPNFYLNTKINTRTDAHDEYLFLHISIAAFGALTDYENVARYDDEILFS